MKLTLLCNAGLALETEHAVLLVDLPNEPFEPFYTLPEETWHQILRREPPYDKVCGFWFSHEHPDHCCREKVRQYQERWPEIPCFFPQEHLPMGRKTMGPFRMEYYRMPHAPIPEAPVHVVTLVHTGEGRVYLPADAELDCGLHREILNGRRCKAAVWNSMYLSRPDTRELMRDTAEHNFICHMPAQRPDGQGLWRKLEHNLQRNAGELIGVKVWDAYPSEERI